jgi:hypothetical protein
VGRELKAASAGMDEESRKHLFGQTAANTARS